MAAELHLGKLVQLAAVPRMVGDSDIALIRAQVGTLAHGARILEFGPWLGGVSTVAVMRARRFAALIPAKARSAITRHR